MATPNLSTNLPWEGLAAGGAALSGLGGDPAAAKAQLGGLYQQQYGAALGMNKSLFDGAQTGYESLRSGVDQQYQDILGGYSQLYGDVLGRIAGSNESNRTDINAQYNAQLGSQAQNAVSRGLGNSTVAGNMMRGVELDRARAMTDSENRFAQLGAGYAANIGSQRLGAQQQGVNLGANLGQAQLGMLERVNAGYPDAGMYGSLAQMYGAQAESDKNRQAQQNAMNMAARGQMSSPGTSSPASPFGSRGFGGGATYGAMGGMLQGAGGGGYGGGGGWSNPWGNQSTTRYGEGFNDTPPLNYDSGYGSMYQGGWESGSQNNIQQDQYGLTDHDYYGRSGGYDNAQVDDYGLTDYDYFGGGSDSGGGDW